MKKKIKKKVPRQYSLVKFHAPLDRWDDYPFTNFEHYIFLGETIQMPGHCTVVDLCGNVYVNYHTEDFEEVLEEDC